MATIYTNDILKVDQQVVSDTYIFRFFWDIWNKTDLELIGKFGDPIINVGGLFGPEGNDNSFTLPDEYVKLKAGFPYVKTFSADDAMFTAASSGWQDGFEGAHYKINPRVRLASDVADFNGPIAITNPGTGYSSAPAVAVLKNVSAINGETITVGINTSGEDTLLTIPNNTLLEDDPVYFTVGIGTTAALPAGLEASKVYFVNSVDGNDITLKPTITGAGLVLTDEGSPAWTLHSGKLFALGTGVLSSTTVVGITFNSDYTNTTDILTTTDKITVMVDAGSYGESPGDEALFIYNSSIPVIRDITAYLGAADATYILSTSRGGLWYVGSNAASCGKLHVTTAETTDGNYVDALPRTTTANAYFNVGTLGLTAKMDPLNNESDLAFPTGLYAGDIWYLPVKAGTSGRVKIDYYREGIFARVDAALKLLRNEAAKDITGSFSHNVNYTV